MEASVPIASIGLFQAALGLSRGWGGGGGRGVAGTSSAPPVQVEIRLQQDSQLKTEMRWPLQGQRAED